MKKPSRLMAAVLSVVAVAASVAFAQDQDLRVVKLKSPCSAFTFNPETGDLVGIESEAGAVTLYSRAYLEGKSSDVLTAPAEVSKDAFWVAYKRVKDKTYYLVACRKDSQLHVLDAQKLQLVKDIHLTTLDPAYLAVASDPKSPYVYYTDGTTTVRSLVE